MKLSELLAKPLSLIGGGKLNLKGFCKRVVDKEVAKEFPYEYIEYPDIHLTYTPDDWINYDDLFTIDTKISIPNIKVEEPYKLFAVGNISYENRTDSSYLNDSSDNSKNYFSFINVIDTEFLFDVNFYEGGLALYIEGGDTKPTSLLYINISKIIAIKADV